MDKSFNDIGELLNAMQEKINDEINGFVSFDKLFDNGFLDRNTKYSSFNQLLEDNNLKVRSQEEFDALDESVLDKIVAEASDYGTWKELYEDAGREYMVKRLREAGFDIIVE